VRRRSLAGHRSNTLNFPGCSRREIPRWTPSQKLRSPAARNDRPLLGAQGKGGGVLHGKTAPPFPPPTTRGAVILNEADEGGEMKNLPQFKAGILRTGLSASFARRNEESPEFNAEILRTVLAA
jgi:hypothetical protein